MLSTSLHGIISGYDDRCVLAANLEFMMLSNPFPKAANDSNDTTEEPSSVTSTQQFATLSDYFDDSYASFLKSEDTNEQFPVVQIQFLTNREFNWLSEMVNLAYKKILFTSRYHQRRHNSLGKEVDVRFWSLHSHRAKLLWHYRHCYVHNLW